MIWLATMSKRTWDMGHAKATMSKRTWDMQVSACETLRSRSGCDNDHDNDKPDDSPAAAAAAAAAAGHWADILANKV